MLVPSDDIGASRGLNYPGKTRSSPLHGKFSVGGIGIVVQLLDTLCVTARPMRSLLLCALLAR